MEPQVKPSLFSSMSIAFLNDPLPPVREIQERYRNRSLTVKSFLQEVIVRVEKVHARTGAVVYRFFSKALEIAESQDQELVRHDPDDLLSRKPLFGIPFSVKGVFAVEGAPWHAGSVKRKNEIALFTDPGVQALIEKGGIPLVLTNVPESAFWVETHNRLFGLTRNPHKTDRSAGGSSGGEGALVGGKAVPFGWGSDTGGSIRIPAFFCGCVGFKPSPFLIPNDGHFPPPPEKGKGMMVSGPLSYHLEDCERVFSSLLKEEDRNEVYLPYLTLSPSEVPLYFYEGFPPIMAEPSIRETLRKVKEVLRSKGFPVYDWEPPSFFSLFHGTLAYMGQEEEEFYTDRILIRSGWLSLLSYYLCLPLGVSPHTLPVLNVAFLERVTKKMGKRWIEEGLKIRERVRNELNALLGKKGVLVGPVFPRPAPRHFTTLFRPYEWVFTGIYNALEYPALSIPYGFTEEGVPLGVQLVSTTRTDGLLFLVARFLRSWDHEKDHEKRG